MILNQQTCYPNENKSYEHKTEKHMANSFYINLHSEHQNIIESQSYSFISNNPEEVLNESNNKPFI